MRRLPQGVAFVQVLTGRGTVAYLAAGLDMRKAWVARRVGAELSARGIRFVVLTERELDAAIA